MALLTLYSQIRFIALHVLQTSKGFLVFLLRQSLSGGGVNVNHNATRSPRFASKSRTENDSSVLKNSEGNRDGEWNFCLGK